MEGTGGFGLFRLLKLFLDDSISSQIKSYGILRSKLTRPYMAIPVDELIDPSAMIL